MLEFYMTLIAARPTCGLQSQSSSRSLNYIYFKKRTPSQSMHIYARNNTESLVRTFLDANSF